MAIDRTLEAATQIVDRALRGKSARPEVASFFDEATHTVTHVLHDPATLRAAIIDSVLDYDPAAGRTGFDSADRIVEHCARLGLEVDWVMETHAHADHLSAAPYLQQKLGGKLAIGRDIVRVQDVFGKIFNAGSDFACNGSQFDHLFDDGERFAIGELEAIALHVPGHTPADMAYVIGDSVFVGDTLFMPDYGTARTLPMPALIMPSVQVNMRGGRLPDPEGNGVRYIRIPVNAL